MTTGESLSTGASGGFQTHRLHDNALYGGSIESDSGRLLTPGVSVRSCYRLRLQV